MIRPMIRPQLQLARQVRVRGNLDLFSDCPYRAVAIVGSRKAHPQAERLAANVAQYLARKGWVIVSGLAPGIDLAAHKATVEAGGRTIAVLGEGLCAISRNAGMASEILQAHGLLVSTVPDTQTATRASLMDRNWLIVGLARAVVVIQADRPSGSLDAALKALQLGRKVYVPSWQGQIASPGTEWLLQQGLAKRLP